jgi:HYR domain
MIATRTIVAASASFLLLSAFSFQGILYSQAITQVYAQGENLTNKGASTDASRSTVSAEGQFLGEDVTNDTTTLLAGTIIVTESGMINAAEGLFNVTLTLSARYSSTAGADAANNTMKIAPNQTRGILELQALMQNITSPNNATTTNLQSNNNASQSVASDDASIIPPRLFNLSNARIVLSENLTSITVTSGLIPLSSQGNTTANTTGPITIADPSADSNANSNTTSGLTSGGVFASLTVENPIDFAAKNQTQKVVNGTDENILSVTIDNSYYDADPQSTVGEVRTFTDDILISTLTPLQESVQQSIEKLKKEGKPYPEVSIETESEVPTPSEIRKSIRSNGSFETSITARTVIEYDGPQEAGEERWDDIIVGGPGSTTTGVKDNKTGVPLHGNLTQMIIKKHPEIYGEGENKHEYGEEPRTFVIDEGINMTFVQSENATVKPLNVTAPSIQREISNKTESYNTIMGSSFVPENITWTINPKEERGRCPFCFTLAEAKARFLLHIAFGIRLPVKVDVTHPESLVAGEEYLFDSSITPLDFAAEDYERMGLPAENGHEFFARYEVFLGVKVWFLGLLLADHAIDEKLDIGEECFKMNSYDCQNFVTPFGPDENGEPRKFPIPELTLDPDATGLEYTFAGIISLAMGVKIDPDLYSDKISAKWYATGDAFGDGEDREMVYSEPTPSKYQFGPIIIPHGSIIMEPLVSSNNDTAMNLAYNNSTTAKGQSRFAVITLDNYKYYLNKYMIELYGNLRLKFLDQDVAQTGYAWLGTYDFSNIFGEHVFGQHHGVGGITFAVPVNDSRADTRILPALNDTSTLDGNDTAAPNVTGTADRAPDSAGFYNKPVTVTWQGDDAPDGSGISSCDEPIEYSGPDGEGIELTGECTDKEGNIGNDTFTFNYDATPPEISVPSADSDGIVAEATGPDGAQVIFDEIVTAEDSIDSSVNIECNPTSGSTFPIGTTTVECKATDDAGNTDTGSFDIMVEDNTTPTPDDDEEDSPPSDERSNNTTESD